MKNILVIRRDNIGDMVCTTPLIEGIKTAFPDARLTLLMNKVAHDVAINNPHIDALYVYKKAKHRARNESALAVYWDRLKLLYSLRRMHFDAAVLANPVPCKYSLRLARMAGVKNIIGAGDNNPAITHCFRKADFSGKHQVQLTFSYLSALTSKPVKIPEVNVYLTAVEKAEASRRLEKLFPEASRVYGVHISSRSVKRRWPLEHYAGLIEKMLEDRQAKILIFWSPQGTLERSDPGDEARMKQLISLANSERVAPYPTSSVRELIAGFDRCEQILCSDGGQMHLASGLHKKQVVFFGDTNAEHWRPWSGSYEILQTASGEAADISIEQAWQAWQRLKLKEVSAQDTVG